MLIYQGEKLEFEGYLRDDNGDVISDLSGKTISLLLKKDNQVYAIWSTNNISNVMPITTGEGGLITFVLPDTVSRDMPVGAYVMEQKITNSDETVVIGIADKQIKICSSDIGQRNDL